MKLPKAEKLKSGNYRIQIQINGKRYSITNSDKKICQQMAKEIYAGAEKEKKIPLTVRKAMENYISDREKVLSPLTIDGYRSIVKNRLQSIMSINISELTQSDIQRAVSEESAKGVSAKTVKNAHGLLTATLAAYRPEFHVRSNLPKSKKEEGRIPTEEEMQKIWHAAKDSKYQLPILLASWLGLRMSEVRGLKYSDISDGKIHIQRARVRAVGKDVDKVPKTESGDRYIHLPETIEKLIEEERAARPDATDESYICPYSHNSIRAAFDDICKEAGVEHCRFHDLRHFAASESLALGVPDKYSMKRMGHATENMLKTVYQHTMDTKEDEFAKMIDNYYEGLYNDVPRDS